MLDPMADYDEERFAEVVLYVAKRLEADPAGGATKLNKILYFADFAHQRGHARPITSAEYQRLEWGPAPRRIVAVRDKLVERGDAALRVDTYFGHRQDRIVPLREPEVSSLGAEELETLDQVIQVLWGKTATELSQCSHEDMAWQLVGTGQTIPYEFAYALPSRLTSRLRARLRMVEAQYSSTC